jgi:hypothetical protein
MIKFFAIKRAAHPSHFPHSNMDPSNNPNQYVFGLDQFGLTPPAMENPNTFDPNHPDYNPNYYSNQPSPNHDNDIDYSRYTQPFPHHPPPYSDSSQNSSTSASTSTTAAAKKARKKTSAVWQHFTELETVDINGAMVTRAQCKRCPNTFAMKKGGGNGHMKRHMQKHMKEDGDAAAVQSRIKFNPDGSLGNFVYDQARQRKAVCRLIAMNDLPLGFGESPGFADYIRSAHTPDFQPVSRQTTSRDMKKLGKEGLEKIKDDFRTCTFSVSITSDIWSGRAKQDYITVVAHYVDNNWELQKRVIGFELIDVAHTGENIAASILKVVQEFDLSSKIFAVTLDNASSNTSAMNILTPLFNVYASEFLLHQRNLQ